MAAPTVVSQREPPDQEAPDPGNSPVVTSWAEELELLEGLASRGRPAVLERLEELLTTHPAATDAYLVAGRVLTVLAENELAIKMFGQATGLARPGSLTWRHPDTMQLVTAQLRTEPERDPAHARSEENLRQNLDALEEIDRETADEIRRAREREDTRVIDIWGCLTIVNQKTSRLAVESESLMNDIKRGLSTRAPVAFLGISSGQEIIYLVDHAPNFLLGMTRPIYLLERNAGVIKTLFRLADLSSALRERRLLVFGGPDWARSLKKIFSTFRFPAPHVFIGDKTPYQAELDRIPEHIQVDPARTRRVEGYYTSEVFLERQQEIARGRVLPRVLLITSRWTTVLQYVAGDFRRGFEDLGCVTETLIEKSDVETMGLGCYMEALDRLQPDLVFSVCHGRPSFPFLPPKLPMVCFFLDRCIPIGELPRIDHLIQPADLFFCISKKFIHYLEEKKVPPEQLSTMAIPADHRVFRPLDPEDPLLQKYASDVSWVKHGGPDVEQVLKDFLSGLRQQFKGTFGIQACRVFEAVHRKVDADQTHHFSDEEILDLAVKEFPAGTPSDWTEKIRWPATQYVDQVFNLSYRQRLLMPLVTSGLTLRLFGRGWNRHSIFSRFAMGPVSRGKELNGVYNASAINLNLFPIGYMHQRLAEGALAGGFFLTNRLDPARNQAPLEPYFEEDRDVVLFDSPRDLLEKCRYYLDHPEERRAIATHMREQALEKLTVEVAARQLLQVFRERLKVTRTSA